MEAFADSFLTPLIGGLVMSAAYILVASGFALVYGVFKVLNFAHGEIYVVGGFVTFSLVRSWGVNYWLTAMAAIVVCSLVGLVIQRAIFQPLWGKPAFAAAIASSGLAMLMQDGAKTLWTGDTVTFQTDYIRNIVELGSVRLSMQKVIVLMVGTLSIAALIYLIHRTSLGKAIRAVAMDREAAGWVGIDTAQIAAVTFVIGGALAGLAAALLVPILSVDPFSGGNLLLKGFVMVVLGGFSLPGVVVGGLFVGIVQSFTATYVSSLFVDSITFIIMILVLLFRPSGLVRERIEENV